MDQFATLLFHNSYNIFYSSSQLESYAIVDIFYGKRVKSYHITLGQTITLVNGQKIVQTFSTGFEQL